MGLGTLWSTLSSLGGVQGVASAAITAMLDLILQAKPAEIAFKIVMTANNSATMTRYVRGPGAASRAPGIMDAVQKIPVGSTSIPGRTTSMLMEIDRALMMPNIAGIPITTTSHVMSRDVEVSEQQVIVQTQGLRRYWTDNAVPRLKEFNVEGYLTSNSPMIDRGVTLKPSLTLQQFYLDTAAASRRPVLYKSSRGEFMKVQITNLRFEEDPTYNNCIKIRCTMKEYNPYVVSDLLDGPAQAVLQG